jgi:hypothetical protein
MRANDLQGESHHWPSAPALRSEESVVARNALVRSNLHQTFGTSKVFHRVEFVAVNTLTRISLVA